jgi:phosphate transport system substrate-binding protein
MCCVIAAAGLAVAAAIASAAGAEVSGAGATFPYPIYAKWAEAYKKEAGVAVSYQAIGSGDGIRQIQAKEVTFGASDMPLNARDLDAEGLLQFPTVVGGIAVVINVAGVAGGELVLDGPTTARIFLGRIRSWNDAAIRKLNPNLKLPAQAITVVHRSDGSGTTFAFTDYLSKVSEEWRLRIGSMTSVDWPVGIGGKGNEGVADNVAKISGAIGYVEYAYAKQGKLNAARLFNKDAKLVSPGTNSFKAAAAHANWEAMPDFRVILTNAGGATSWPIAGATFILMHKRPDDPVSSAAALKFFDWAYTKGSGLAEELDYVPMPANVVAAVRKLWASEIKDAGGAPIYAASK